MTSQEDAKEPEVGAKHFARLEARAATLTYRLSMAGNPDIMGDEKAELKSIQWVIDYARTQAALAQAERKRADDALEEAATVCESTCGKWCAPTAYVRLKNPDAELYCPCAKAIRALKTKGAT